MVQETTSLALNSMGTTPLPPAQLWIGPESALIAHTVSYLQKIFCKKQACNQCIICKQITDYQFHSARWIRPEKGYTLDDLASIKQTIVFALETNQEFFFILEKADFLSDACANALLKAVEEPPRGYHFIFLASRLDPILPTIRSRCIVSSIAGKQEHSNHLALFDHLTHAKDPMGFFKTLEASKINEVESIELLDQLLSYWIKALKKAIQHALQKDIVHARTQLAHLQRAAQKPPMPGSSKLFWRNLFLMMQSNSKK